MRSAASPRLLVLRTLKLSFVIVAVGLLLFLPFAGRFFNAQDDLHRADLILVLAGARIERWLEAVQLFQEGWAPRIVISPGPVEGIEAELHARGVRYPREGDLARDAVIALGVPPHAVSVLPNGADNTAAEASALRKTLAPGSVQRILVVSSPFHLRRAGYAFRREFEGTGVEVLMRGSRFSESRPARWWTRRGDIRFMMSELPKFAAYLAGLGP